MAFEKADAFFNRNAKSIRIFVIILILLAILLRIGIAHIQEYNRVADLREQGWYLVGTCAWDVFLMFDAKDSAELDQKMQQYEDEWKSCVQRELEGTLAPNVKPTKYILIPDAGIKYGKTSQCDHSGYTVNLSCDTYRDHAVKQIDWVNENK
jgi:hypothetical protein